MHTLATRLIKDSSFIASSPRMEKTFIQAHLAATEAKLRRVKSSNPRREEVLDILSDYWHADVFPKNTYMPGRTPIFIDATGVHCAVGHLMAMTGFSRLAQEIDGENKFVFINELADDRINTWLAIVGLTREEAALIQPAYGCPGHAGTEYPNKDGSCPSLSPFNGVIPLPLIIFIISVLFALIIIGLIIAKKKLKEKKSKKLEWNAIEEFEEDI